jgi:predicted NUDIX family NTP pyrophosphohydrolase
MKKSAGILMVRERAGHIEFFLVHPGGPFWKNRDAGAWTIPKGMVNPGEDALAAARREFEEETGFIVDGTFVPLGSFKQPGGKHVEAFAVAGDCDPDKLVSNEFEMPWPPHSGRMQRFPEVDRGGWFGEDEAREKLLIGQQPIIDRFLELRAQGK